MTTAVRFTLNIFPPCLSAGIDVDIAVEHRGKQKKCKGKKGRRNHGYGGGWWGFAGPYGPYGGNPEPFSGQGRQTGSQNANNEETKQSEKPSTEQKQNAKGAESEPMVCTSFSLHRSFTFNFRSSAVCDS